MLIALKFKLRENVRVFGWSECAGVRAGGNVRVFGWVVVFVSVWIRRPIKYKQRTPRGNFLKKIYRTIEKGLT